VSRRLRVTICGASHTARLREAPLLTARYMDKAIADYFVGKPDSFEIFKAVYEQVRSFGWLDVTVGSQISFGVKRKFAWFWLYNVTRKNPNGILHMMLRVDRKIGDPHIRNIEQIGKNRWNHQVVVRTLRDAQSKWLHQLLKGAYEFGSSP
jgi:hypothetical protein